MADETKPRFLPVRTGVETGLRSSKNTPAAAFLTSYAPFAYEPTARRAANGDRNPLLRKGSETTAHVAGFGLAIGGLRPSNTSMGFSTV